MDAELEEGEILDEKSPTKRARWSRSFGNEERLPFEYTGVLKKKRTAYERHVCKSHTKFPKKENKPLIKNESIRTVRRIEPNITYSKSPKNNYVKQKNSAPHPSINKSSHNGRSTVNGSKSVVKNHYASVQRKDYFQCTSYPERTSHSKMSIDASYEDLLNQYKSIQSELASIHKKTPSWSSSKNSELKIRHSKSNSSKKKKMQSSNNKCAFKHKKVSSQNLNEVLSKKEKGPSENKSSNFSKPKEEEEEDEDLDQLRRTALATCAKLPPSPVPIEAENDELKVNTPTFFFRGDNYEVVDMDVSSNCDDEISQGGSINGESSLNEVAQDDSVHDIMEMDDDDEDDEEVLRAQLILALNKSKQEEDREIIENYVESTSKDKSILEIDLVSPNSESDINEVAIPNDFQEDVHVSVDIQDVLKNVSNTVPPHEEFQASPENGCNMIDSTTFPKTVPEVMLQSAVVSDLSNCSSTVNSVFDDVPNLISKEIVSRNVILEHSYQNANLKTVIENHIPPENRNESAIAETELNSVASLSSSRTVIIENSNIDLKHDHPSMHPTLSVTCLSDNSKLRKVHVMKRKPLPYFSAPVQPFIIKFDKDSSESESDTDVSTDISNAQYLNTDGSINAQYLNTDGSINAPCLSTDENMAQKLERLIENAKNKSDSSSVQHVESKGMPPMQQSDEMKSISPVPNPTTNAKEPQVRETIPKSKVQLDEKAQNIEAFNKVFNKLKLVESTYYKEVMLYNNYKMVACKQKSLFITSLAEVARLKEQLSREEKLRNSHKNRMFEANEKVAATQESMNARKLFMERLKADCLKEGIKIFGPNYSLPKHINSPFKFKRKPF